MDFQDSEVLSPVIIATEQVVTPLDHRQLAIDIFQGIQDSKLSKNPNKDLDLEFLVDDPHVNFKNLVEKFSDCYGHPLLTDQKLFYNVIENYL